MAKRRNWHDAVSVRIVDHGIECDYRPVKHATSVALGGLFLGAVGAVHAHDKNRAKYYETVTVELIFPDGHVVTKEDRVNGPIHTYALELIEALEAKKVAEATSTWSLQDSISIKETGRHEKWVQFLLIYPDGTTEEMIAEVNGGLYRYLMGRKDELGAKRE